jgi:PTS system galactitol-specific IIC component
MGITLWIATQTIGFHTQLAANAGALKAGGWLPQWTRAVLR